MLGRRLFASATVLASLLAARESAAFCRTTTCDANTEDCKTNDNGCVRDGVPVIWSTMPITYRFYHDGSAKIDDTKGLKAAIKAAFDTWSAVKCTGGRTSVRFVEGPDITTDKPLKAKQASEPYGIYFRDDSWPHDDANESLALTNQIYGERTGTIDYADIEVNTAATDFTLDDPSTNGIDFQSVMTHEAGHYLGLAHSNNEESIMVARYCASSDRCNGDLDSMRALSKDDQDAVCALYPASAADDAGSLDPTTAGCSQTGFPRHSVVDAAALAFVASAIVRRRLRSKRQDFPGK